MSGVTITLNGVALGSAVPQFRVRDINRGLVGEPRHVFADMPGRAGSWVFTEEPGDRTITIEGLLLADGTAARRTAMLALAEWATTAGTVAMTFSDEPNRYYEVLLAETPDVNEALRYGEVELEFRAGPFPVASGTSTQLIAATGGSPKNGTFSVSGDLNSEPVIEITPKNGTMTGFTLTVNGYSITWSGGTLLTNETITISSLSDTVTLGANADVNLTGAFDPNDVDMANVSISGFPELQPGTNSWSLVWTGTATSVDIEFTWRERYN